MQIALHMHFNFYWVILFHPRVAIHFHSDVTADTMKTFSCWCYFQRDIIKLIPRNVDVFLWELSTILSGMNTNLPSFWKKSLRQHCQHECIKQRENNYTSMKCQHCACNKACMFTTICLPDDIVKIHSLFIPTQTEIGAQKLGSFCTLELNLSWRLPGEPIPFCHLFLIVLELTAHLEAPILSKKEMGGLHAWHTLTYKQQQRGSDINRTPRKTK